MDGLTIGWLFALSILVTATGIALSLLLISLRIPGVALLERATRHLGRGTYIGGLPVVLGALIAFLSPEPATSPETVALLAGTLACAILGFLHDLGLIAWRVLLPYLLFVFLGGAWAGVTVTPPSFPLGIALAVLWPIPIIISLYISSYIFGMPSLLCLGSGLTFLLFFSGQEATPAAAFPFTLSMIATPSLVLVSAALGRRLLLGSSGHLALGWLLAALSMLGRSKTLLGIGLLVPAAVLVLPPAFVSILILLSYLGNELYEPDPTRRHRSFVWNLPRRHLVLIAGLVFLTPNFAILLYASRSAAWGYLALAVLVIATLAWFIRILARPAAQEDHAPADSGSEAVDKQKRITILGSPVDAISRQNALAQIAAWLGAGDGFHHLITADSLALERARHDRSFAQALSQASLVLPDGAGLVWAADVLGTPIVERIPGVGLVDDLCRLAADAHQSVYFVGARPGIIEVAVEQIQERIPGLSVAGTHHGYFAPDSAEEADVIRTILAAQPRLVFVAMGVPRQEEFIAKLRPVARGMIAIGVGGSFDVLSGRLPRAPLWMQRFALEWLFRLYREPSRFRRMLRIPVFVAAVLREKLNRPGLQK